MQNFKFSSTLSTSIIHSRNHTSLSLQNFINKIHFEQKERCLYFMNIPKFFIFHVINSKTSPLPALSKRNNRPSSLPRNKKGAPCHVEMSPNVKDFQWRSIILQFIRRFASSRSSWWSLRGGCTLYWAPSADESRLSRNGRRQRAKCQLHRGRINQHIGLKWNECYSDRLSIPSS